MSYLETIEFLVKEVAKKDKEIKSLSIALESKERLCKNLEAISDKRLEELVLKEDELGDAEANLHWIEDKLSEMTKEKDLWKSEALEYRDKEKQWWVEEKELKELRAFKEKHKDSWATEFAYHHLKKAYDDNNSYYEERIAKLQVEINHLKNNK